MDNETTLDSEPGPVPTDPPSTANSDAASRSVVGSTLGTAGQDADRTTTADTLAGGTADPAHASDPSATVTNEPGSGLGLDAPTSFRPPRFLGGYELIDEVARGGMGIVYRARQVHLNRIVALKLVRDPALASFTELRRFRAEAEAVALLDHPNIVPIYEVGQVENQPYFSMKLIEGHNLSAHVGHLKEDPRDAAALMVAVARAVHYAHQRAILHRDIKPSNILLDEAGEPYVTDFGLAKRIGPDSGTEATVTGAVMGTPAYMPPEQARGDTKVVTTAADVYSLGATLYDILTGQPPFSGESAAAILRRVLDQEPARPRTLNTKIDRELETICLKCLEKEPARRYASANALAEDLQNWLDHKPIKARPVKVWERGWKWARRHPALAAVSVALLFTLLGSIIHGAWVNRDLQRALDLAYRDGYAADMSLARQAWESGDVYRARETLKKYYDPPSRLSDYRGFEWYYLWKRCDPRLITLSAHRGDVLSVAYSPDGRLLATGGVDATIWLWDPEQKLRIRPLKGHTASVNTLAFRSDGQLLASGSSDGSIRLWDVATGECRKTLSIKRKVYSLAFHPKDGQTLAVATDIGDRIALWDVETCRERWVVEPPSRSPNYDTWTYHHGNRFRFTRDGSRMFTASQDTAYGVGVWDIQGAAPRLMKPKLPQSSSIFGLSLSGDERWLVTLTNSQSIGVWDAATLVPNPFRPEGGIGGVHTAQAKCSAVGHLIAFSSATIGRTDLWDLDVRRRIDSIPVGLTMALEGLAFRPDGRRLATASGDHVEVARITTILAREPEPDVVSEPEAEIGALSLREDGALLAWASNDTKVMVCDLRRRESIRRLVGQTSQVTALAYGPPAAPDLLATAGADGKIRLWDRDGAAPGPLVMPGRNGVSGHDGAVEDVAFLSDGRTLVSAGADGKIMFWTVDTGQRTRTIDGQAGPLRGLAVAQDGLRVAAASGDGSVLVWKVQGGWGPLGPLNLGAIVNDLAFSPDGTKLAAAGGSTLGSGGTVALWDASSGSPLGKWFTPTAIQSLTFTRDGRRVVTGGAEGTLVVWDTVTGRETLALSGHSRAVHSLVSAPGLSIYSASLDGTVKLWEGIDPGPPAPAPPLRGDGKIVRTRPSH